MKAPDFNDVVFLDTIGPDIGCHLRIWHDGGRTIVVAGQLQDRPITPQGIIETCVSEIARIHLPRGEDFEFYLHYPQDGSRRATHPLVRVTFTLDQDARKGAALITRIGQLAGGLDQLEKEASQHPAFSDPQWRDLSLDEFRLHTGLELEHFVASTYKKDPVREYIATGAPVAVLVDPYHLRDSVRHLKTLGSVLRNSPPGPVADVVLMALGVIARAALAIESAYSCSAARRKSQGVLQETCPRLPETDRALVVECGELPGVPPARRATICADILDIIDVFRQDDDFVAALRFAYGHISWWAETPADKARRSRRRDHVLSDVIRVIGAADSDYLQTVTWQTGPDPDFTEVLAPLRERARHFPGPGEFRAGVDPWGRKVAEWTVTSPGGRSVAHYVVEWPCQRPDPAFPDEAVIVSPRDPGGAGGRPVYVRLPDGTYDLLPVPRDAILPPPFTWGYGGEGPTRLYLAMRDACCGDITEDDERGSGADRLREFVFSFPPSQDFQIEVGRVREHFSR
ncbi:hypothetical protein [Herbidospora cretacea]|uniref:hypothetical protein n=1 Tax=Herbidospora cretacea TaxID=28444 RepID=UPI000774CFE5|nr:hypothetical protein [Herbidospora cretacea]